MSLIKIKYTRKIKFSMDSRLLSIAQLNILSLKAY